MAVFSATSKLPLVTEFLISGGWTDATTDRFIEDGRTLEISRGRRDWSERVIASRCGQAFANHDGKYSNRKATSPLYGKLGRYTRMRHRLRWVYDPFDARTVAGGWGSADPLGVGTGQAWTTSGGAAGDYSVGGGVGVHTHPTANVSHNTLLVAPALISDVQAVVNISALATGGIVTVGIGMGQDQDNHYRAMLDLTTGGAVQLEIIKRVGGVTTQVAAPGTVGTYAAGTRWVVRLQRYSGGLWRAAAYRESDNLSQVATWQRVARDVPTISFTTVVARSTRDAANTNAGLEVRYDNVEVNNHRFHGETAASAPEWVLGSTDTGRGKVLAPFTAAGILERLTTGTPAAYSAIQRTAMLAEGAVALWPLEDASGSTTFASGLADNTAAGTVSAFAAPGTVTAAGASGIFPGAATAPTIAAGGQLDFVVPNYTETGACSALIPFYIPSTTNAGLQIQVRYWSGAVMDLTILPTGSGVLITSLRTDLSINDPGYTTYWSDSEIGSLADLVGRPVLCSVVMTNSGSGEIDFYSTSGTLLRSLTGSGSASAYGKVRSVRIMGVTGGSSDLCAVGAVQVYNRNAATAGGGAYFASTAVAAAKAMGGHNSETAWTRINRVGVEDGIATWLMDTADASKRVGVQPVASTAEIMFRAAEVDQGILYEPRDAVGLSFRPLNTLFDQTAALTLDFDGGHVAEPFLPTEDGMTLLNDSTATMDGGTSARVVVKDGPLGTQAIGTKNEGKAWNAVDAGGLAGIAGWRTRLGTFDESRWPSLRVNLAAPDVSGSAALVGQVAAVDLGDVVTVTDLPSWLPPDDVPELVQGSVESFGDGTEWEITWNAIPANAYRVYQYGLTDADTNPLVGRYGPDPGSAFLFTGITETGTTLVLAANPPFDMAANTYTPVPVRILMEGEEIWLTGTPSGPTSPQTFTGCTRSVNGVVKLHNAGATYELIDNAIYVP